MVNKAFITFCFPLNEPWTLASMDLLSTGKSLNEELMKKAMKLIKKVLIHKKKSIFLFLSSRQNIFCLEAWNSWDFM